MAIPLYIDGLWRKKRVRWSIVSAAIVVATLVVLDRIFPPKLPDATRDFAQVVVDSQGEPLRVFADENGVWRYQVAIGDVSPVYLEALLTYEDRWFYYHYGVNPLALVRAVYQRLSHGRTVSGGSTLTMQVARIFEPHSKTLRGKLYQMLRAVQLEWRFSKEEILTYYLNYAPFGGAIEGVQAASFTYLSKTSDQLSHADAALLAVLPQAPSRLRPDRYPDRAEKARNKVLDRMVEFGMWSQTLVDDVKEEPVDAYYRTVPNLSPLLARRLRRQHPNTALIPTYIDSDVQQGLEDIVANYINRFPIKTSAAVLILDNQRLETIAYLGSADFSNNQRYAHVDMVTATRSPGSTLKPFLYALALDDGLIHEQSLLLDVPSDFNGYKPLNFNQGFNGPVSMRQALQQSLNVPAVQVADAYGIEKFAANLSSIGFSFNTKPNLAMVLGGVGTNLEQLTQSYALFGRKGLTRRAALTPLAKHDIDRRFISESAAWVTADVMAAAPISRVHSVALEDRFSGVSFKTGTSYGYRDAWALATTEHYTLGIWIGRPDGTPLPDNYGRQAAVPLLRTVLHLLPESTLTQAPRPYTVSQHAICWPLGSLKSLQQASWCMQEKPAWLIDELAPSQSLQDPLDEFWLGGLLDIRVNKQGQRLSAGCDDTVFTTKRLAIWPASVQPWLPAKWRRSQQLPPYAPGCQQSTALAALKITGIDNNSVILPAHGDTALPTITAKVDQAGADLHWFLDGIWHGEGASCILDTLSAGAHKLSVIDANGRFDEVVFSVSL